MGAHNVGRSRLHQRRPSRIDTLTKEVKRAGHGFRRFDHYRKPGDEDRWRCEDDGYLGLGGGAALIDRVVLAQGRGHYDSLSDLTHRFVR